MIRSMIPCRLRLLSVVLVALLSLPGALFAQGVTFGPGLEAALAGLGPDESLEVVVTFDQEGPLSQAQVEDVRALGVSRGIYFRSLPVLGALATAEQVRALAGLPGVLSIWPNEQLTYYNDGSRDLTGVERLREDSRLRTAQGVPFSGKGVTVVVNDTGIDATHADLEYGSHVVENAQGLTNLHALDTLLPITYTEGHPNTDTNSGHGTHCAGTVGGTGALSGGKYEGVAPGADLVGYGSGAVLFILDAIGGFDYAITHQFAFRNPIRVITNSWGTSGTFNPANPVNQVSYRAYKRGIVVVFAAGNDGSGDNTHNPYAVAPWVISVGAGDKKAALADFSSRGVRDQAFTFKMPDGTTWTAPNEPSVVAPGVDIISVRASTNATANGGDEDLEAIEPAYLPYYTMISGTSMATPHVAGIAALMLEANPQLSPQEIKEILQRTATNMPGRDDWEAGAGYVNAYDAVVSALGLRTDFGATVNALRTFHSNALLSNLDTTAFSIDFSPLGPTETDSFYVPANIAIVKAWAQVPDNTVALVLTDPAGNRYASSITLPEIGELASVAAPGREGVWKLTVRGIGSIFGVRLDPLGVTNGTALPGTIEGSRSFVRSDGYTGLEDIAGHPAQGAIEYAVGNRLADGHANGRYRPDAPLRRGELAQYLVMGAGIRQTLPLDGSATYADVSDEDAPFVEAATAKGGALKDRAQRFDGVIRADASFRPKNGVTRADLAYSLVQSLGFQAVAAGYEGEVVVLYNDERLLVEDWADIPAALRGYVQLALDLGLLNAYFKLEQGPYDLEPTVKAYFRPQEAVTRAAFAVAASRMHGLYDAADPGTGDGSTAGRLQGEAAGETVLDARLQPDRYALEQNYPNPFNPTTQIRFALPEAGPARLTVYDVLGREVKVLVDGPLSAGAHAVTFDAAGLASGTYLYRLETAERTFTRQMILVK